MKKSVRFSSRGLYYALWGILLFASGPVLAQNYNTSLPQQCNAVTGGQETLTFPGTPVNAIGDATLTIQYEGDLDGTGTNLEILDFLGEGGVNLGTTSSITQCTGTGTFTTTIPVATVAAWAATGGSIEIVADANGNVNNALAACNSNSFCVTATLSYPVSTGPDDAGVSALISPASVFCTNPQNVTIRVNNFGTNQITGVDMNWTIDGVAQTPVSIPQTLDTNGGTGSSDTLLNLGNVNFTGITTLLFWTTNPNGTTDPTPANDTLRVVVGPGLSGTYTLGTPTSDFPDFATFESIVNTYNICGPTIINVEPGTYNETLELLGTLNTSAVNTLTINGAGAGTSILSSTAAVSSNAVVYLNGADHVTIKNMTIRNTGTGIDQWGILLNNEADHNTIDSCTVEMPITTSADVVGILVSSSNTAVTGEDNNADYLTVSNSRITGGQRCIHLEGDAGQANLNRGHVIQNNTLMYADDFAISGDALDSLFILNNTIDSLISTAADGMDLDNFMNFEIVGNYINVPDFGMDLDDANFDFVPNGRALIANNMIAALDDGVNFDDMDDTDIFHNTFLGEPGVAGNDLSNLDVRNNIFASRNTFSVDLADATPIGTVDYNIYYTENGTNLAQYGPSNLIDLAAIIAADPTSNQNSLEGDPGFISATNLRIIGSLPGDVGDNSVGITVDIDGDVRPDPNSTIVDIGADEFITPEDDAAMVLIESPNTPFCAGDSAVVVSFQNTGTDTLFTVDLAFSVNGGTPVVLNWSDTLLPGDIATGVTIGNHSGPFANGDDIIAWTANPNGMADIRALFDTADAVVGIGLSGTYVIDGNAGPTADYISFQDAIDDLNLFGACSAVIFEVTDFTYNEQLVLEEYIGASAANTVTFRSQSGDSTAVILEWGGHTSTTNYVVRFNGGDHYRFEQMTIQTAGNASFNRVLDYQTEADSNRISNCVLGGAAINNTSTNHAIVYSANTLDDGNYFGHNVFQGGSYGLYWFGVSVTSLESGSVIEHNQFLDQYIYAMSINEQFAPVISGNFITSTSVNTGTTYGLDVDDCRGPTIIDNNHIVSDINSDFPTYGFHIEDTEGLFTDPIMMTNNRVLVSETGATVYASEIDDVEFVRVENNTFVVGQGGTASRAFHAPSTTVVAFVYNNIMVNFGSGYAIYQTAGSITDADNNLYYTNGNNLGFSGSATGSLIGWQAATNFDAHSMQLDPMFADSIEMYVCLDTLDNAGLSTGNVLVDFEGQPRNVNAPDIGADEFTSLGNFSLGADRVLCDGATIDLMVNDFDTVIWNNTVNANMISVGTTGSVTVEVRSACGTALDTVAILAQQQPSLPANAPLCINGSVTLDPGIADGTYLWVPSGSTDSVLVVTTPGTYRVEITDAFGCTSVDSTIITVAPVVDLVDTTILCEGGAVQLDAGIPGTYQWNTTPPQTSQSISVSTPGSYAVEVTNGPCVSSDTTEVVLLGFPVAGFTTSTSALAVTFSSTSTGATTYNWDFGDGASGNLDSLTHVYAWPGGTFTVTFTASNQCGSDDSVAVITVNPEVGINELGAGVEVNVFPIPAREAFFVSFSQAMDEEVTLQLLDISGKVHHTQVVQPQANAPIRVATGDLAAGLYLLRMETATDVQVVRVAVQ